MYVYKKNCLNCILLLEKHCNLKKNFDQYITQRRQGAQQIKHQVYLKILDMLCEDIHHRIVNCIIIEKKIPYFIQSSSFEKDQYRLKMAKTIKPS